jgi:hypothetical protein
MSIVCSVKANRTPKFTIISKEILPFAASRITSFDGIITVLRLSEVSCVVQYHRNPNKSHTLMMPHNGGGGGGGAGGHGYGYGGYGGNGGVNEMNGNSHGNHGNGTYTHHNGSNGANGHNGAAPNGGGQDRDNNNSNNGDDVIVADFDDVVLRSDDCSCTFKSSREDANVSAVTKVFVIGNSDFTLLQAVINEARRIRDLRLQVAASTRDIYYSHFYSVVDPNADVVVSDEFAKISQEEEMGPEELLLLLRKPSKGKEIEEVSKAQPSPKSPRTVDYSRFNIECVYCNIKRVNAPETLFTVHPYVPNNYENRPIFMCLPCAENWKDYREKAIRDDILILENEVNEEICSVCSDMPEELILCSKCPRSFCDQCLHKSVPATKLAKMLKEDDWLCMCCATACDSTALLGKDTWHIIKPSPLSVSGTVGGSKLKHSVEGDEATSPHTESEPVTEDSAEMVSSAGAGTRRSSRPTTFASVLQHSLAANKSSFSVGSTVSPVAAPREEPIVRPAARLWSEEEIAALRAAANKHKNMITDILRDSALREMLVDRSDSSILCKIKWMLQNPVKAETQIERTVESSKDERSSLAEVAASRRRQNREPDAALPDDEKMELERSESKRRRQSREKNEISVATVEAPKKNAQSESNRKQVSEYFYFANYVKFYDGVCTMATKAGRRKTATDDSCFLCKDGGELVECDHKLCGTRGGPFGCRKVYHDYCLSYKVPESVSVWICPRHYCDVCGSDKLTYMCKYCPFSICARCPEAMVERFGLAKYKAVSKPLTGEFDDSVQVVVCQTCLNAVEQCKMSKDLPARYVIDGEERTFPGVFNPDALHKSRRGGKGDSSSKGVTDIVDCNVSEHDEIVIFQSAADTRRKRRSFPVENADDTAIKTENSGPGAAEDDKPDPSTLTAGSVDPVTVSQDEPSDRLVNKCDQNDPTDGIPGIPVTTAECLNITSSSNRRQRVRLQLSQKSRI